MKRSLLRTIIFSIAATAFVIQGQPATATDCVVKAYEAYLFVTLKAKAPFNRKMLFTCGGARFQADSASGLSCAGTTSETRAGPGRVGVKLFATPGASIWISNGWRMIGFDVLGGKITKTLHRDSLISFTFKVSGQGTAFERNLKSIKLSKPGGNCSNVLAEAFDWSK